MVIKSKAPRTWTVLGVFSVREEVCWNLNVIYGWITIVPGIVTLIAFVIPNLDLEIRLMFIFALTSIYFALIIVYLNLEHKKQTKILDRNQKIFKYNNEERKKYEAFIHKRKSFMRYDLLKIKELSRDYHSFVRDKYRGKKFEQIVSESKVLRDEIERVIIHEERLFDEQLYDIQSNKDNWWI